jgi:hypothetical protein
MTFDRADQIIDTLGHILAELKASPVDSTRLSQIAQDLTTIETELALRPPPGPPVKV